VQSFRAVVCSHACREGSNVSMGALGVVCALVLGAVPARERSAARARNEGENFVIDSTVSATWRMAERRCDQFFAT